ncbi:MAG: ankyrin repeat domain-containing protein [Armatimonadia bacterium]
MERLTGKDAEQMLQAVREHDGARLQSLVAGGLSPNVCSEMGETPLGLAVYADDAEMVSLLLASGASPGQEHMDMGLPLDIAASRGRLPVLKALLDAGLNPNDGTLGHPLLTAVRNGQSGASWLLLAYGADPNAAGADGLAPLHYAAMRDARETVAVLLQNGASPDARTTGGAPPLHVGAMANAIRVLALLKDGGANLNALAVTLDEGVMQQCASLGCSTLCSHPLTASCITGGAANADRWQEHGLGFSALHYAAASGATDAIEYLCAAGADRTAGTFASPVAGSLAEYPGLALPTPLHLAVAAGELPAVAALVSHGADMNARSHPRLALAPPCRDCGFPVSSPLQWAVKLGQHKIAWFLLERGAPASPLGSDAWGAAPVRPLYSAVMAGDDDMARLLIRHGANPNDWRDKGDAEASKAPETLTPLHWAAAKGDLSFALTLLAHGADINAGAAHRSTPTPLDCALAQGHEEMAEVLREHGASASLGLDDCPAGETTKGGSSC